ncbi:MAG: MAPEG family protein [Gammaproteobacteria bacterium]|nr:MAPEG family protein [Gammaproteobacteria bacterium]
MSGELIYLTCTIVFTALLWIPYVLNQISIQGLVNAVGYPENPVPLAPWAQRLKAAHYNAVENLVLFAPLVFVVEIAGLTSPATQLSCLVFFVARIAHAVTYALAVPWARSLSFAVGYLALLGIVYQIITA